MQNQLVFLFKMEGRTNSAMEMAIKMDNYSESHIINDLSRKVSNLDDLNPIKRIPSKKKKDPVSCITNIFFYFPFFRLW